MPDLTETERETLAAVFAGWSTMPNALPEAVERILAARRESDAETIRGLRERYERLRGDVAALANEWEDHAADGGNGRHGFRAYEYGGEYVAADLRAILARHERPDGEAVEEIHADEACDRIAGCISNVSDLPEWMQVPALGRDMRPICELVVRAMLDAFTVTRKPEAGDPR